MSRVEFHLDNRVPSLTSRTFRRCDLEVNGHVGLKGGEETAALAFVPYGEYKFEFEFEPGSVMAVASPGVDLVQALKVKRGTGRFEVCVPLELICICVILLSIEYRVSVSRGRIAFSRGICGCDVRALS